MTQFHEGQEVEVSTAGKFAHSGHIWRYARKAKIVARQRDDNGEELLHPSYFPVEFPDGTRAVFDAERIRAIAARPIIQAGDPQFEDLWVESGFDVKP